MSRLFCFMMSSKVRKPVKRYMREPVLLASVLSLLFVLMGCHRATLLWKDDSNFTFPWEALELRDGNVIVLDRATRIGRDQVVLLNPENGEILTSFPLNARPIDGAWLNNSSIFVCFTGFNTLEVFSVDAKEKTIKRISSVNILAEDEGVGALLLLPDDRHLMVGGLERLIMVDISNLNAPRVAWRSEHKSQWVRGLRFSQERRTILALHMTSEITEWDMDGAFKGLPSASRYRGIYDGEFASDREVVLFGESIERVNVDTDKQILMYQGLSRPAISAFIHKNSFCMAALNEDGDIQIWNVETGERIGSSHVRYVQAIRSVSADCSRWIFLAKDGSVGVFSVD